MTNPSTPKPPPPSSPPAELREQQPAPGVLQWVLDKPARRNAIGPAMFEWITGRCPTLAGEVVIIRGAGEQAFTAGFDLKALAERAASQAKPPDDVLIAATRAMQAADATFIAALNGYVIGAGVELIASCDFRIACPRASLRVPAGKLGVVYHAAGLARIHAAFGPTVVRRLFLAGETIPIADASASLTQVVAAEELDAEALALAQRIRAQSARSVAGNRRLLRALDQLAGLPPDLLELHERARREAYEQIGRGSS